ncbi:MAG TPA: molybdenum cofactor biosynthesis protein MoaE [Candidatus Nitrosocosmicus sp.]|nr:molybdenum cofactor biosynthesis protein MoaE [Candidatus Nitrosocosmicus sp.]
MNSSKLTDRSNQKKNQVNCAKVDDNNEILDSKITRITTSEIDTRTIIDSLNDKKGESGATVVFVGSVRNYGKKGLVKEMFYESYVKMAEKRIKNIEKTAIKRWNIKKIRIVHRIGQIKLGSNSVVIALSTPHSKDAFEACEFILAAIKREVPIWKKELLSDNKEEWVDGSLIKEDGNDTILFSDL